MRAVASGGSLVSTPIIEILEDYGEWSLVVRTETFYLPYFPKGIHPNLMHNIHERDADLTLLSWSAIAEKGKFYCYTCHEKPPRELLSKLKFLL
jgi:hypothetical protein